MRKSETKQEPILSSLGEAIYVRRMSLGLSQQELADQASVHRTYISDIERGARNLTITTLTRISLALGSTAAKLLKIAEASALR